MMRKMLKGSMIAFAMLTVLLMTVCASDGGVNKVYKKWDFLADAYVANNVYPTDNTYKDLYGNAVWSTYTYLSGAKTAMLPVAAMKGVTPAMWSKTGAQTGAPLMQIRAASANMFRVTPSSTGGAPMLRWTSSIDGTVQVTGKVLKEATGGNGTTIELYRNDVLLESVAVGASDITLKQLAHGFSVAIGDTVELAVLSNNDGAGDVSTMNLIIEEINSVTFDAAPKLTYTYCGEEVGTLMPGGTVSATLGATNLSSSAVNLNGVLAVYSANKTLLGIGFDKIENLAGGQSVTLNCNIENYTPSNNDLTGSSVKMFVWNTLKDAIPMYTGFKYPPDVPMTWDFEGDNVAMGLPSTVPFGDKYGATQVWSYGMGNHQIVGQSRPYDFRPLTYDSAANIWYNNEEPKMAVAYNFPYIKISATTGQSELQTRSRTADQQLIEGTTNARLHPIVRFISPIDGQVKLDITLTKKATGGDGILFMMGINGNIPSEYASLISIGATAATNSISKTITVEKGMAVDFLIHGLGNNSDDGARLQVKVTELK